MEKITTPLTIITSVFALSFFDGMFGWGLDEGAYMLMGLAQLVSIVWLWIVVKSN